MLQRHSSFRKIAAIFLSATTLMWSLGASLTALLLLANPAPVLAATPTIMFAELDTADANNQTLRVKFSEAVDQTTAETEANYTLHHTTTFYPNTATRQTDTTMVVLVFTATLGPSNPIIIGDTGDTLDIIGVKDGAEANPTNIIGMHLFGGADMGGGFFGPAVIVNEAVSNPQRDWNDSTPGGATKFDAAYGTGTIDANDEYVELRINQAGLNLLQTATPNKYYLKIFNTDFTTVIGGSASNLEQYHATTNPAGIFDTVRYIGSGSAGNTAAGAFLVLGGLRNADLADNVHVALYSGPVFMNSVSFGTFNDMMTDDNAAACGAATGTEASGRDNFGTDMGWNKGDFYQQAGSPGTENTYDPPLKLFGVFQQDATHIGLDFNEPPKQDTITAGNFTITKVSDSSTIVVSSAFVESMGGGRFVKLTLASTPVSNMEYRVTVGAGVTDQTDKPLATTDRIRSFMGFSVDTTPPVITGINQPDSKRLEIYFQDQNGINVGDATVTVAETATPANTIAVSGKWSSFDMVTLDLAAAPTAAMAYTVTFTGLKDWVMPAPNTLTTNNTAAFTGKNFTTLLNDGMAPYVMRTVPMDFEASVPTNIKKITVGFSEKMDPATVIAANVKLYNYTMSTGALGSEITSGVTVAYNSDLQTATILLTNALAASSSYQIFVDGETVSTANAVKDLSGSAMGYNYTSIFTTGAGTDTTTANIISTGVDSYWDAGTSKYKNVPVGIGRISVAFDGAMDSSTIVDSDASNAGSPIRISTTSGGITTYAYGSIEYDILTC